MRQVIPYPSLSMISLVNLRVVTILLLGNVYIGDFNNHRVRKVTVSTGIMSTIAGTGDGSSTSGSYSGDNGPATSAGLYRPTGVCPDSSGKIINHQLFNQLTSRF